MFKMKTLIRNEVIRVPLQCLAAAAGGFLLSSGTVCGVASPLAAAVAGICQPLYGGFMLLGVLLTFVFQGLQPQMYFLLSALLAVVCMRILFFDARRPHMLAFLTAFAGILGGAAADFLFHTNRGRFPAFVLESMLLGIAVYFLADAWESLRSERKICLTAGKSFTFAVAFLLGITALTGLELPFCNIGRITGITVTMLAARNFRHSGGTLCGALTACGVCLCSVELGMSLLFLPVTGMMAGFLAAVPNALLIPLFCFIQMLSAAVFDGSDEIIRVMMELILASVIYAMSCRSDWYRLFSFGREFSMPSSIRDRKAMHLSATLETLRKENTAVMQRLRPAAPPDAMAEIRQSVCEGCKNEEYCWKHRAEQTIEAMQHLLHRTEEGGIPESLGSCIRTSRLRRMIAERRTSSAMTQMQRTQLNHDRMVMMEYLQLLEELSLQPVRSEQPVPCSEESAMLQKLLRDCRIMDGDGVVYKLKNGRYIAEVFTAMKEFPLSAVRELLGERLGVTLCSQSDTEVPEHTRYCFYQQPAYTLEIVQKSVNAPQYSRCGDSAETFSDPMGNQYLVVSDGMGSGAAASLTSRIAVRTFRRMVLCGMAVPSAIRLINLLLLTETGTEGFATMDVLRLQADTGRLELYKSGASSTIVQHHRQVMRIASPSFPVGIIPHAEPFCKEMSASPDDRIVMLTDGIHEAEYPYIKELLLRGMPLAALAEEVCSKAATFCGGSANDDMTIVAAAVRMNDSGGAAEPFSVKPECRTACVQAS